MKKKTKLKQNSNLLKDILACVGGLTVLVLIGVSLKSTYHMIVEPKFKVGDCIQSNWQDPWQTHFKYKVLEIGKKHYLLMSLNDWSLGNKETTDSTTTISFIDSSYDNMECPKEKE